MGDNSARVTIDRWLADAADHRRNGCNSTDVDTLREHLTEALEKIDGLESVKADALSVATDRIDELTAEAECSYTADDRKIHGRSCDDCHACRLSDSKRQIDCGADDAQRDAGVCKSAADLGIDRCCACGAHRAEKRLEDECADRDAEIARLTRERDEARNERNAAKSAAEEIARVRSLPALISADSVERLSFDLAELTRSEEAKRETLLRQIDGLNNQIRIVTEERNAAIVKADSRPLPAVKARAAKRGMESGSLFDRIPVAAEPVAPVTADAKPKRKGRKVKIYPLTPAKVTP